ncbi:hypothetical protein FKM82_015056 [Ascaphus truei]
MYGKKEHPNDNQLSYTTFTTVLVFGPTSYAHTLLLYPCYLPLHLSGVFCMNTCFCYVNITEPCCLVDIFYPPRSRTVFFCCWY